jgi:WD40 repeat protein
LISGSFSPDGKRIVTTSMDNTARIWDAETGKSLAVLRGHGSWVNSGAFSPDGTRVVTASQDETVRVWDAATGEELAVLSGHKSYVFSAAYSLDGAHIVSASLSDPARIWDVRLTSLPVQDLVDEVCKRKLLGLTKLTSDEMRLAGYPESTTEIDVCQGVD